MCRKVVWSIVPCVGMHFMSYSLTPLSWSYSIMALHWCNTKFSVRLKNYITVIPNHAPLCIDSANLLQCRNFKWQPKHFNWALLQVSTFVLSGKWRLLMCEWSRCGDFKRTFGTVLEASFHSKCLCFGSGSGEWDTQCHYSRKFLSWLDARQRYSNGWKEIRNKSSSFIFQSDTNVVHNHHQKQIR